MSDEKRMMPPMLRRHWFWTVALAALSAVYSIAMTALLHTKTPYGLNLVWGSDRWWDFLVFGPRFVHFGSPEFWTMLSYPFTYPAPLAVVFGLLYKLAHPLRDYLAACVAALLGWAWWLARALRAKGVSFGLALAFALTIGATAFPVWFLLVTGNIEGLVALTLSVGVLAALRGRWWLGAGLIGAAGAMKIYPLILLGLLLSRRRYKEFGWGLAVAAMVTVASLAVLGPSVMQAEKNIANGILFVKDAFVFSLAGDDFVCNHSLFVPLKIVISRLHPDPRPIYLAAWNYLDQPARQHALLERPYEIYVACVAVFGLAAYFLRIRRLPMLNQAIALTVCAVLLPPISLDYTLVDLLLPFGLLCVYTAERRRVEHAMLFACFAVIFTLGTFFTIKYRLAAPMRTLALVVLLVESMRQRLDWAELDGEAC